MFERRPSCAAAAARAWRSSFQAGAYFRAASYLATASFRRPSRSGKLPLRPLHGVEADQRIAELTGAGIVAGGDGPMQAGGALDQVARSQSGHRTDSWSELLASAGAFGPWAARRTPIVIADGWAKKNGAAPELAQMATESAHPDSLCALDAARE